MRISHCKNPTITIISPYLLRNLNNKVNFATVRVLLCVFLFFNNMFTSITSNYYMHFLFKIVKELLVKEAREGDIDSGDGEAWCSEDELPEETRCKVEGLKAMARWLLGLKQDTASAQKTFRMLNAFILHKGDLLQSGRLSKAEMSWLRLAAGCAMLKVCEQKGVGDQYTAEQFYNLSQLMTDEVKQVREIFATKLHKGKCYFLIYLNLFITRIHIIDCIYRN